MKFENLLDADDDNGLSHGAILRCEGKWPYEAVVDFMVIEGYDKARGMSLLVSTGHKAGLTLVSLPIESGTPQLSIKWVKENWENWIYPDCDPSKVFLSYGYPSPKCLPAPGEVPVVSQTPAVFNSRCLVSKKPTGNGVSADTVGKYKIKVDENTGTVCFGTGKNEIHTFYKNDARIPNSKLREDAIKRAENGTLQDMTDALIRAGLALHFVDNNLVVFDQEDIDDIIEVTVNEIKDFGYEDLNLVYKHWWDAGEKELAVSYMMVDGLLSVFLSEELSILETLYEPSADVTQINMLDEDANARIPRAPCPICNYETQHGFGYICSVCNWEEGAFHNDISHVNSLVDKTAATISSYQKEWSEKLQSASKNMSSDSILLMKLFDEIRTYLNETSSKQ